jgi:hypothetical protein
VSVRKTTPYNKQLQASFASLTTTQTGLDRVGCGRVLRELDPE